MSDLEIGATQLASLENIGKISIYEDHLLVEASIEQAGKISEHLANAKIYPRRIELEESNLEDFFINIMKTTTNN